MKILIAIDGSTSSLAALRFVHKHRIGGEQVTITLIHVDVPLNGYVVDHLDPVAVERYHADNTRSALRAARRAMKQSNLPHDEVTRIGDPAAEIIEVARRGRFDMIAMGSHGWGALASTLLGSVVQKVLSHSKIPVLVTR
jgi:nucleotide-binding universal stress UspA family protein